MLVTSFFCVCLAYHDHVLIERWQSSTQIGICPRLFWKMSLCSLHTSIVSSSAIYPTLLSICYFLLCRICPKYLNFLFKVYMIFVYLFSCIWFVYLFSYFCASVFVNTRTMHGPVFWGLVQPEKDSNLRWAWSGVWFNKKTGITQYWPGPARLYLLEVSDRSVQAQPTHEIVSIHRFRIMHWGFHITLLERFF